MGNPVSHAEIHPLETKKDKRTLLDLHKLFRSQRLPAFACFQVSRQTGTERKQEVSVKAVPYQGIPGAEHRAGGRGLGEPDQSCLQPQRSSGAETILIQKV